ncbi:MAG: YceI family protein [Ginsengibacter sp.]
MKKIAGVFAILVFFATNVTAQIQLTRNGKVTFFSLAPLENIEAVNNEVTSILDVKKGEFAFVVLIKSFKFKKALMEEHFNENYMESNTFPKASFKGSITDMSKLDFTKDGTYPVTVAGDLTIHGITKKVEAPGTLTITGDIINATSKFSAKVKDYNIKIPSVVENKIAETVDVSVDCKYEPSKKS